jgi:hypothetical protein
MLRAAIGRYVNQTAINRQLHHVPVRLSMLGEHAELMAAAGIAIERFVQGELEPEVSDISHQGSPLPGRPSRPDSVRAVDGSGR